MKEPGLDGRNRDKNGKIELKKGNTLNKNLSQPIKQFSPLAKVETMRKATGKKSIAGIRKIAARKQP